ncbi:hypothetical protein AGABI2DRAFT_176347 [Agaricus bisporus var. bisporus H97]|uniref:hypothetical protein n=1 Tax=Agaricus bisporus var. bisporus (strain H97 / ATCC MYA-4626 / FGSC 10389) TaxID=936046 RepID=UPI00029F6754|nr:hypothetical protein AGABI2DRAFT_176347 [Agaricus bisporus var. bisporus H97]EKV49687.1 hypothetical protein AGABI2DRAFT_176347 [Agaricus bisporus var. bisporus H97]
MDEFYMAVYRIKDAVLCPIAAEDEERFLNMIVIRELEKCTGPLHVVIGNPCDYSLRCRHESLPEENVTPLAVLPFISTNFKIPCIQVRVTFKSRLHDPRHPTQNLGFYIHLMDESGEVRAEVDTDLLADEIYDRFQVGRLYNIYHSGHKGFFEGRTFLYNLKDRSLLDISSWTVIEECSVISRLPPYRFSFTPIPRLVKMERNDKITSTYDPYNDTLLTWSVDVLAIVKDVSVIDDTLKVPVRQVIIFDQSELELLVKLFSYNAEEFVARPGDIVAFRNAHLLEHVEHTQSKYYADGGELMSHTTSPTYCNILSVITPSTVHLEPEVEERYALRRWYNMSFLGSSKDESGLCKHEEQKAIAKLCEGQNIDV